MAIYLKSFGKKKKKIQRERVKKKGLCWVPYVHRTCECSVHCVRPKVVYTDLVQLRSGASCQSGYTPHRSCDPVACAPCGHFWPHPCTSGQTVCIRRLLPVSPPSSILSVSLGRTSPVITYGKWQFSQSFIQVLIIYIALNIISWGGGYFSYKLWS